MSNEYEDMNAVLAASKQAKETPVTTDTSVASEGVQDEVESDPTTQQVQSEEEVDEEAALVADEDDTSAEQVESDPTTHRSKAAEKRIAKLVREREQLKGQLALYQAQPQTQQTNQQVAYVPDPNAPDPANYPAGVDDLDYRLDLREHQRAQIKKDQDFKAKIAEAIQKDPTLQELIAEDRAATNATMADLIKESDRGVELFSFLMANPDVSNKIAAMSPTQTAKEIGRIEAKLEEKAKATSPTPSKKVVTPPAPITPVKSSKTVTPKQTTRYTVY
jgi:hypothetical protein